MAEPHTPHRRLIEEHLDRVRMSLGAHPHADRRLDELRDHLLTATEHHEAEGLDPLTAERRAVEELGDAATLATAYAANGRGRPAVPTSMTRLGGVAAFVAIPASLWAAVAWTWGDRVEAERGWGSAAQLWYGLGGVGVLVATTSLLVAAVAVVRRHGGLGSAGWMAVGAAGLGTVVSVLSWAVGAWATLLALAWTLLAVATRRARIAPAWALGAIALGSGAMPALIVASGAAASDRWAGAGAWEVAGPALGAAAIAVLAAGCVGLGRWLTGEVPVDLELPTPLAAG